MTDNERRQIRIEALQAASRIVTGQCAVGILGGDSDSTLSLAEQFARWLETGER